MLEIVLLILKIIGLLLLGILGLFLALVLLVLFVPIPYHVWVKGDSGKREELSYRVKVFGIQVFPRKERKKRRGKQKRGEKPPEIPRAETKGTAGTGQEPENGRQPAEPQTEHRNETAEQEAQHKRKGKKDPKPSKGKEKNAAGRDVRAMLGQLRTEFTDEGNRKALGHLFSEIRYLLRHFGPRRVRADVSFSLGDPANTGYATAALSMCPFSYGKDCRITPDFETEKLYVRGCLDARGHVRAIHVLIAGLRLLFDRNIRKIIGKLLKKNNNKSNQKSNNKKD